ncbi:MAG TPA: hypothetical protein DDW52_20640 [Planctomycetaceae bacterium]|nr:hypothetical protein [Planctomycetaceae bacterium]
MSRGMSADQATAASQTDARKNVGRPMIEAIGLSKFYGPFAAARDVNFHVSEGELVAFLGPNGAGKSTTMNALTEAEVEAVDKLFATLDTRTRRWTLPSWGPVLLSDTVGFIRDLPHHLVASFRATLEEAREADLLLHVADASNPNVLDQISSVYDVLHDLGIEEKQTLLVVNKMDVPGAAERLQVVQNRYPHSVAISARSGAGLDQLSRRVSAALSEGFVTLSVRLDVSDGKTMAWIAKVGEVVSKQFHDDHVEIHTRMPVRSVGKLRRGGHEIEVLKGKIPEPGPVTEAWEEQLPTSGQAMPGQSQAEPPPIEGEVA